MKKRFNLVKTLIHVIERAIVGVGAILPGVSGGVLCVSFGMYEPMMELLTEPKKALKKNYDMFIPFILGGAVGFVLLAGVMEAFFNFAPDVAIMLFFGLVCGTLPELFKKSELADKNASWLPMIASLTASYVLFHALGSGEAVAVPANFFSFLFCGFMWGVSLIVPGMSSSTVLIYLGLYVPLTEGISNFDFSILIPFGIGILITVLLFAKLVNMLFKKYYAIISRIILGFVISSSLKTLPSKFESGWTMVISIACLVLGFLVALWMDRAERKQNKNNGG